MIDDVSDSPVWAMLAPLDVNVLREEALAAFRADYPNSWDEEDIEEFEESALSSWKFVRGTAGYSAVVDYDRGSEGTESPVIETLSRNHEGTFYVLYFTDEAECVTAYENGEEIDFIETWPSDFALSLGCALPGAED